MRIGIVGAEAAKFTSEGERAAKELICSLLQDGDVVVSGECHLGGIDIWAKEIALAGKYYGYMGFAPAVHTWSDGYRPRNIDIATHSDYVVSLVVDRYPDGYTGMRFDYCYHCRSRTHIKSGGCWTVKYAAKIGVPGDVLVVRN